MAEDTVKRNKRQYAWIKENTDRMNLIFEKGTKDRVTAAANKKNISASEYVRQAIAAALEQDNI